MGVLKSHQKSHSRHVRPALKSHSRQKMSYKGKEIAGKGSSGKRKRDDDDKSGSRKRKNSAVLQFFEDAAEVDNDSSDDSISGDGINYVYLHCGFEFVHVFVRIFKGFWC